MKPMDSMRKFFTNDAVLKVFFYIGAIERLCYLTFHNILYYVETGEVQLGLIGFFRVFCLIALYISFQCHSKNIMKGMMGALLAFQVATSAVNPFSLEYDDIDAIFGMAFMIFSLALFVNHFWINSDRHSSPMNIFANQILCFLLIIVTGAWSVWAVFHSSNTLDIVSEVLDIFGNTGFYITIVCIESRLDVYRIDRENAGWTEEKGYPEDYVHAYQKK